MTEVEQRKRRYLLLIQQLDVMVIYANEIKISKRQKEEAIDRILDEMIDIRKFLKANS
jgi:hypothetical protein